MSDYMKGYLVLIITILVVSMDTITIRFSGIDGMSVAIWRNGGAAICMFLLALTNYGISGVKKHLKAMTWKNKIACLLFGFSGIFFSLAVQETTIVKVLIMFVLSPLLAVIMSAVFLKERINNVVKITSVFVVIGTFWAYKDSFDAGFDLGIVYSFLFVLANSSLSIVGRSMKAFPTSIMVMIGCGFWAILLSFTGVAVPQGAFAMGNMLANIAIIAFAYWSIVYSSRFISAPEVNLMVMSEAFFGTVMAWIILNEIPTNENIIGGLIAMVAIVINLSYTIYIQRKNKRLKKRNTKNTMSDY